MIGSVLYSDTRPPTSDYFSGYAFVGHDYVVGSRGAEEYKAARAEAVTGGHDGCYLSVSVRDGKFIFDTDYGGFKTLFYFADGTHWIVSDSWWLILEHMRERGIAVKPNYSMLLATSRLTSLQQLSTFETPAQGVHMVPLHHELVVTAGVLRLQARPELSGMSPVSSYEEAMHNVVALWVGRFKTLLAHPSGLNMRVDLSGGLDSRVTFAMYIAASNSLKDEGVVDQNVPKIISGTGPHSRRDFEVASDIAGSFDLELNDSRVFEMARLKPGESFERWKEAYLGTYHPVYFPSVHPCGRVVQFGGIGSENHRGFYQGLFGKISPSEFVDRHAAKIEAPEYSLEYKVALNRAFAVISKGLSSDESVAEHYRQFRSRIHGGVHALARVTFSPFSSRGFDQARVLGGPTRFDQAQMNYDVLSLLEPRLLEMDFDDSKKAPTAAVREILLHGPLPRSVSTGSIFGDLDESLYSSNGSLQIEKSASLAEIASAEFSRAMSDEFVKSVLPEKVLDAALEQVQHLIQGGRFPRAGHALPFSLVLTAREVSPNFELSRSSTK